MRYRSVDSLGPGHVGCRVTVRRRLDEGGLSDVVGMLEYFNPSELGVRDRHGRLVWIPHDTVTAARIITRPQE